MKQQIKITLLDTKAPTPNPLGRPANPIVGQIYEAAMGNNGKGVSVDFGNRFEARDMVGRVKSYAKTRKIDMEARCDEQGRLFAWVKGELHDD